MAKIVGSFATSHAYTFLEPSAWQQRRNLSRGNYEKRFGRAPEQRPELESESLADNSARYRSIRDALDFVRTRVVELDPDVIVLIGDDQDENFIESNLPQFALYVGDKYEGADRSSGNRLDCRSDSAMARFILNDMVDSGFDIASSHSFEGGALRSHAHNEPLNHILPFSTVPVLPIFVNAIHVPAPTPARCLQFGQGLRAAIDRYPHDMRIILGASGGLSHFTAGYPYQHLAGPHPFGAIHVEFDQFLTGLLREGEATKLSRLSSYDLLANGDVEFRQWIALCGTLDVGIKPELLVYEPFFSALMGMSVGFWKMAD